MINSGKGSFPGRPDNGHSISENSIPEVLAEKTENDMTVEIYGAIPSHILFDGIPVGFEYDGRKASFIAKTENRGNKTFIYSVSY